MQRTDFDYEILVGEDCSTDRTRDIVTEFQRRFPGRVRALLHEQNLGLKGKRNFVRTLGECKGQYVAMLEGDDYWTSPDKLQKQVEYLDSHPECSICFHDVTVVYEDGSKEPHRFCPAGQKEISTIEDLLKGNFMSTCSVMFRRGLFGEFPAWFYEVLVGDWPLHIFNAVHGRIGYLDEVMGAYRVSGGGVWALQSRAPQLSDSIRVLDYADTYLRGKYTGLIRATKSSWYFQLAEVYEASGEIGRARTSLLKSFAESFFSTGISDKPFLRLLLKLYAPSLYRLSRTLSKA